MSDSLSTAERLALIKVVNALMQADFDSLLFALNVPYGLIPSGDSAQGNRASALLQWVQSPTGCGLNEFLHALDAIAPGSFKAMPPDAQASKGYQVPLGGGVTLDMVYIPGGRFWMGSPEDEEGRHDNEGPQHKVQVPSFYMGKYPVTQVQWRAVSLLDDVDLKLKPNPSRFSGDKLPVEQVNWDEAVEFCVRLSKHTGRKYRLPSEAEWEYACRVGTTTPFYTGEKLLREQANSSSFYKGTAEVGRFPPNSFGLYDMHGNVWEWCLDDWHDNYKGAPVDGSAWVGGDDYRRVIRGGSWDDDPWDCRSAYRGWYFPVFDYDDLLGFRVVCSAPRTL